MRYLAVLRAEPGCDYSIGCGVHLVELTAASISLAHEEMLRQLQQEFRETSEPTEYHLVQIYEVSNRMESDRIQLQSMRDEWKKRIEAEEKVEAEAAERREFERLKQKFSASSGS